MFCMEARGKRFGLRPGASRHSTTKHIVCRGLLLLHIMLRDALATAWSSSSNYMELLHVHEAAQKLFESGSLSARSSSNMRVELLQRVRRAAPPTVLSYSNKSGGLRHHADNLRGEVPRCG